MNVHPGRIVNLVEYVCGVAVLVICAIFYSWTATSAANPFSSKLQKDDLYNRLSDGFLAGHLSFVEKPNPALADLPDPWEPSQNAGLSALHDVSYYRGKYYLYFGAAPAVLLLAPWKAITGTYLGENVAAVIFGWLGVAGSMGLVIVLRRKHFPSVGGFCSGLCFLVIAFGNFVLVLLRRPVFYELAISSAYAFAMAALLCIALALNHSRWRPLWLSLSGLAYGLTLASRPNYLFGAVILAVPFVAAFRSWRCGGSIHRFRLIRDVGSVALPFAAVVLALLIYNYERFDRWLEFGQNYQLSGLNPRKDMVTTFSFMPVNLWYYFLAPAQISAYFPFFEVIHIPWFTPPSGYSGEEDVYGICNMPFYILTFCLLGFWRDRHIISALDLLDLVVGMLALFVCNLMVIGRIGGAANRYMVDLLPVLIPLACLGVFRLEQIMLGHWRRRIVRFCWGTALFYTVAFNIFVSFAHNDLLRRFNPLTYRKIAHAFDHISSWLGETRPSKIGPLAIKLKLPRGKTGHLEPLLITGLAFKADFIYLYYTDPNHIQIGFEHTSYGGMMTKVPIKVDYGSEHAVEISMGSLYPPVEHPYFDGIEGQKIEILKRTLLVTLDGRNVLSGKFEFYDSSPGDVHIGRNLVSHAFGDRFTGEVLEVSRRSLLFNR